MDGIDYFRSPHLPAPICEADEWRRPLRQTVVCAIAVIGIVIGLNMLGVHIPVIAEYPSDLHFP